MEDRWLDALYHLNLQPSELDGLPVRRVRDVIHAVNDIRERAKKEA